MEQQAVFKTSMFGFDKKAVLDYIFTLNEQLQEVKNQMQAQIDTLVQERDQLAQQVGALQKGMSELSAGLEKEKQQSGELTNMIATLTGQIEKHEATIEEKERELKTQGERARQLRIKAETLELKSKRYDDVTKQMGDLLIDARNSADDIIDSAKLKARDILESSERSTEDIKQELGTLQDQISGIHQASIAFNEQVEMHIQQLGLLVNQALQRLECATELPDMLQEETFELLKDKEGEHTSQGIFGKAFEHGEESAESKPFANAFTSAGQQEREEDDHKQYFSFDRLFSPE